MATSAVISMMPSSFAYQDLISQVQVIQHQMNEIENILDDRWKNEKKVETGFKSRSLIFIDPYGNQMINNHMDHESLGKIIKKYKKNYVPKYLQQWIKIGTIDSNGISSLTDSNLVSTVSNYTDGYQFIAYGEVTLWIGSYENITPRKILLGVLLTDNIEKIKVRIKEQTYFINIELKLCKINQMLTSNEKYWNEGTGFKLDDTIMSCRLYEDNSIIMAKVSKQKINNIDSTIALDVFVRTLTGKPINIFANSAMSIATVKELIQDKEGIPPDQQRIKFCGLLLEDDKTLADYNIRDEDTIHLTLCLRGGMYHETSGRQDFDELPYNGAKAVKDVLSFKFNDITHDHPLSLTRLQESVLQARIILSNLYVEVQNNPFHQHIKDVKSIILSTTVDDKNNSDSEGDA